jgi:hypothetical protein
MKIQFRKSMSKYVAFVGFAICLVASMGAKSDQIAQGTVQVTITASTSEVVTSGTCGVSIGTYVTVATGTILTYGTSRSVAATIQGGTVACVVTVPYYWTVPSLDGSSIGIDYSVNAQNTTTLLNISTSGDFASIPLSTTGTTTRNVSTVF